MQTYTGFGGVGASGYGRVHGYKQFVQNSNEKTVIYKSPVHLAADLFAPPYTDMDKRLLGFVTGSLGSYN